MQIQEAISLVGAIATGVQELKKAFDAVPLPIFLPPAKKRLVELQDQINSIEKKVSSLEGKVNTSFPELSRLIRSYSRLISDVRIAGALSDKAAEIYGLAPDLAPRVTTMFANDRQNDYSRVSSGVSQLPNLDVSEKGQLDAKLSMIRDLIRDMKSADQNNASGIKSILDNISTQYSDTQSILENLLGKILANLEIPTKQ